MNRATTEKQPTNRPEWLDDPDLFVFAGEEEIPVGATRQHGLIDHVGNLFSRSKEDVQANWEKVESQIRFLLERVKRTTNQFELEEVSFELGFSAEGQIVFVAKGGVKTTVRATFRRNDSRSELQTNI